MKVMMKTVMGLSVLLTLAGCYSEKKEWRDAERNEVIRCLRGWRPSGEGVRYIEEKNTQTPEVRDVVLWNFVYIAQNYRIENHRITRCSILTNNTPEFSALDEAYFRVNDAIQQQANNMRLSEASEHNSIVTAINMGTGRGIFKPTPSSLYYENGVEWEGWCVLKQTGSFDEMPSNINALHKVVTQALSSPEHTRNYPSYLRAVPLLTAEELEAEKDTPVINTEKARYHVQFATRLPYALVPVPEKESPFPNIRKYTPGDKFKVKYGDGYMLIETFKGVMQ